MYDLKKESPTVRHLINRAGLPMKSIGMEFSDLEDSMSKSRAES